MQKIRYGFVVLGMLLCLVTSATAGVSIGIGIGLPTVSIGINLPLYPELVPVPGYPVYYAPGIDGNYFFYDGMYWVYQDDNWYASSWYNGPWGFVDPTVVPLFVLRVPVSYYRQPPIYFSGWRSDAPPRWGQRWGHSWEQRRGGWDRWDRRSAPRAAPLPVYQRQYAGDRYPRAEQQRSLRSQQYRYQPRDKVVRQHLKQVDHTPAPALRQRQEKPQVRTPQRQENQHSQPQRQSAPTAQRPQPQRGGENERRAAPVQAPAQQRGPAHEQRQQPAAAPREQRAPQHELKQQPAAAPREQRAPQEREQQRGQEQRQENGGSHDRGGPQDRGHGNKDEGRGR